MRFNQTAIEPLPALMAAGSRFGDRGTHTSRTIMLKEILELFAVVAAHADRATYTAAIVDENVLGKVVLRVPLAGRVIQNGGPLVFGLIVGLLVTLAVFCQDSGKAIERAGRLETQTAPASLRTRTPVQRTRRNRAA